MQANWKNKSLEQLENEVWNEPNDLSRLSQRCHRLRKKKLEEFEIEDLRIMIGQNLGLKFLIPISIEKLSENLFVSGDFYDGDLLQSVLNVGSSFWQMNSTDKEKVEWLIRGKEDKLRGNKITFANFLNA